MKRKVTEEVKNSIYELNQLGYTYREISKILGFSPSTIYKYVLMSKIGIDSDMSYTNYFANQKGFESFKEYKEHLAKIAGYDSYSEYQMDQDFDRSKREKYQTMKNIIRERLDSLGKTPKWLARSLGVSKRTIYQYLEGKRFPSKEILPRLLDILELPHEFFGEVE